LKLETNSPHPELFDLRVEGLLKYLGDFALQADFSIGVGERAALLGKSGSGKTTLLRVLAGLEALSGPADAGNIYLGQREITALSPQKRNVGLVFQDQALFGGLNVLENVTFGLRMRGVGKEERDSLALPWLEKVGLKNLVRAPVGQLSGGEKQRVAFIRALIWRPHLVLLDEPFSALDSELRSVLRNELVELHKLWPAPLLFVTHDETDIQAVATVRLNLSWETSSGSSSSVRRVSRVLTNP
jgi:ABC-type Fe3+/spermidine/putrescine transport system ATPase subunit